MTAKTMSATPKIHVIACGVLALDINQTVEKLGLEVTTDYLPGGLHNEPMKLRSRLQDAIDRASAKGGLDRIAVGYGVCGMGTVEIQAQDVPVVIPKAHDCIAMFLGSDARYREEFARFPGTFYYSAGWCTENVQPRTVEQQKAWMGEKTVTLEELEEQYGAAHAGEVMKFLSSWQANYQRAAFVDTGAPKKAAHEKRARDMAEKHGWHFEKIKGDLSLLEKMLTATRTTDEVLVIPPGYFTAFDAMEGRLMAVPEKNDFPLPPGLKSSAARAVSKGRTGKGRELKIRYGLGIDAGGTYTDAVIYDFKNNRRHGKAKALTTKWDFTVGIGQALDELDPELLKKVELAAVSTTMATNAIVEGEGQKVGLLMMTPYGRSGTQQIDHEPQALLDGCLEISGREKEAINPAQVRQVVRRMVDSQAVKAFAVSGFAGAINPAHELAVKAIIREETGCSVTCGHELSEMLDFKTRAGTAVLNARIIPRLAKLILELEAVLRERGIKAPMVVVKGDGSLISAEVAKDKPVETVLSGPAASVAGARFLTGREDAVVVDVGGTTTDTAALKSGLVRVVESGTRVGGFKTHVRALEMRTTGLGGDSAIVWKKDRFEIGPRRVAPMAWLGAQHPGVKTALDYIQHRLDRFRSDSRPLQLLTLTGHSGQLDGLVLTEMERRILEALQARPHTLSELADKTGIGYWRLLPLDRLEANCLVQRCGLTPTDLLHVSGRFTRWDVATAQRAVDMQRRLVPDNGRDLVEFLLDEIIRRVAVELLKKQLDETTEADALDDCPVCQALLGNLFEGDTDNIGFRLKMDMSRPVIGIGAPAAFFVPRAGEMLGAEVIMHQDADVANAIGAITSDVMIRRQLRIKPTDSGRFLIEGIAGVKSFAHFQEANDWALAELKSIILAAGRTTGTSNQEVEMDIDDAVVNAATGAKLFLGRTITARLTGRPDLVIEG